jgi:hypothetical protein
VFNFCIVYWVLRHSPCLFFKKLKNYRNSIAPLLTVLSAIPEVTRPERYAVLLPGRCGWRGWRVGRWRPVRDWAEAAVADAVAGTGEPELHGVPLARFRDDVLDVSEGAAPADGEAPLAGPELELVADWYRTRARHISKATGLTLPPLLLLRLGSRLGVPGLDALLATSAEHDAAVHSGTAILGLRAQGCFLF